MRGLTAKYGYFGILAATILKCTTSAVRLTMLPKLNKNQEHLHAVNSSLQMPLVPQQILSFLTLAFIGEAAVIYYVLTLDIIIAPEKQAEQCKGGNNEGTPTVGVFCLLLVIVKKHL
jgi:hypothetical protein